MNDERRPRPNLITPRHVVAAIVIAIVLWFAFANSQRVRVDFLLTHRNSRLIYVILGSAVLGAIADRLITWRRGRERDRDRDRG
jgi:uncharacterized integral membrane protein